MKIMNNQMKSNIFPNKMLLLIAALIIISGCANYGSSIQLPVTDEPAVEPLIHKEQNENFDQHDFTEEPVTASTDPNLARLSERLLAEGIDCTTENELSTENSLAVDANNPNIIYVGVEGKGVFKSADKGANWRKIVKGILVYPDRNNPDEPCFYDIKKIVIDQANSQHLFMAIGDMSSGYIDWPYAETGGVWESLNGGESWYQIMQGGLNTAGTGAFAVDPSNTKIIYYGVNSDYPTFAEAPIKESLNKIGILYKTIDGGKTWEELPTGVLTGTQGTAVFINEKSPYNILLLTQSHDHIQLGGGAYREEPIEKQFGPMKSSDGGKTWIALAENLPKDRRLLFDGDVSKHNFDHIIARSFLFGSGVPQGVEQKSFYSTNGGETFQETGQYIHVGRYDIHDTTGNHLLGYSPWQGWVVESNDAGATWMPLNAPEEVSSFKIKVTNFVWDHKDANVVYMTGTKGYVWQSLDKGNTWKVILSAEKLPK